MDRRALAVAAVVLLLVPSALAYTFSPSNYPSRRETLVEGHTVFALLTQQWCMDPSNDRTVRCPSGTRSASGSDHMGWQNYTIQRLGTAVAVLVRDRAKHLQEPPTDPRCHSNRDVVASLFFENPGVLWFNDQFLVGDDLDLVEAEADANADACTKQRDVATRFDQLDWRHPCGGWVLAVQAGNPDPRPLLGLAVGSDPFWAYVESYYITDPNNQGWLVDKYAPWSLYVGPVSYTSPRFRSTTYYVGPIDFMASSFEMWAVPVQMAGSPDAGPASGADCPPIEGAGSPPYNALLFFFMDDLAATSGLVKEHGRNGRDDGDAAACAPTEPSPTPDPWSPCLPGQGQGNSHPYNPDHPGDSGPRHLHPTARVDIYFSNEPPPAPPSRHYTVYDTVGDGAPVHEHTNEAFDNRLHHHDCVREERYQEEERWVFNGGGQWEQTHYSNSTTSREQCGRSYF